MPMKPTHLRLVVLLILCFFGTRLTGLHTFPIFIDEAFHIRMAEGIVTNASPLDQLGEGRQFTAYWYGLFQSWQRDPVWVARAATVLISAFGFAAYLSIAHKLSGWQAMVGTGLLLIFSPYHYFFERLALADSVAAVGAAGAVAVALHVRRRVRWRDAVIVGLLLFFAVGAKVNMLVYLGIPAAAVITLKPSQRRWTHQIAWGAVAAGIPLILLVALALVARARGIGFFDGLIGRGIGDSSGFAVRSLIDTMTTNAWAFWETLAVYFGGIVLIALGVACAGLLFRRQGFLLLCLFAPLLAILASQVQQPRYWVVVVALMLTAGGIILGDLSQRLRFGGAVVAGVTSIFGVLVWLPFASAAWTTSLALPLPDADYRQYLLAEGAGTGFDAVLDTLAAQDDLTRVIGALPHCHGLRYMSIRRDLPLTIECPLLRPSGQDRDTVAAWIDEQQAAGVFVVLDEAPYVPASSPGRLIETITVTGRGDTRPTLRIFDLSPIP
ncbi:MAG: hypothetical protein SF162_14825 [bacterium]|nr:hypothetical protein [bacterium]